MATPAMTIVVQDMISHGAQVAEQIRALKGTLEELNILYDGQYKALLVQDDLDSVPSYSGITKQQLDDGMYFLTSVLLPAVNTSYTQLVDLAARA